MVFDNRLITAVALLQHKVQVSCQMAAIMQTLFNWSITAQCKKF